MLVEEEVYQLANKLTENESTKYVLVTGLSGSGKTWVADRLEEKLGDVERLSDGILPSLVAEDVEGKYHIKQDGWFLVTDHALDDEMHRRIFEQALSTEKDWCIIEIARGHDEEGIRDLSFRRLEANLPQTIKDEGVLIYVASSDEERISRNGFREATNDRYDYRRVNPLAIERFYQTDDFEEWRMETEIGQAIVLEN